MKQREALKLLPLFEKFILSPIAIDSIAMFWNHSLSIPSKLIAKIVPNTAFTDFTV